MKRVSLMILVLATLLTGCQSTDNGANVIGAKSPVIFRVTGTPFTVADFQRRMDEEIGDTIQGFLNDGQTADQITELADQSNVRASIFDRMVQEELLMRIARQEGVNIDASKVEEQVELQLPAPTTDEVAPFQDLTSKRALAARQQVVLEMIIRYTRADMFKSRHVLVDDEATADQVLAELKAGKSFSEVAATYSKDNSSASTGGELGWVPRGAFVAEFEEAAFSAALNTPIKVQSQFGWHVIEVLDRQNNRPFENIDQIQNDLRTAQSQGRPSYYETTFVPWYDRVRADAIANGDLEIVTDFDPNSVPLPRLN